MAMKEVVLVRKYVGRDGEKRSTYTKVGVAFEASNGSLRLVIEPGIALVGTADENVTVWIQEPRQRDGGGYQKREQPKPEPSEGGGNDMPW